MNADLRKAVEGLDDSGLDEFEQAIQEVREQRGPKFDIDSIRPDMSAEERAKAWAAIRKAEANLRR
jgi:lipoate synthase